jgi:tripartite-type tricarboxylate transporter receptor subunit TctC
VDARRDLPLHSIGSRPSGGGTAFDPRLSWTLSKHDIAESGYKDYELEFWIGMVAPAKTPKETLSQLADWFTAAVQEPEVKAKLALQGLYPDVACGAEFGALLRKQYDEFGRIIHEANIKAQ